MIPPGVDLEPHLALRRDLRRAGARARRQARAVPRLDLLAAMQNWADPPRNRPTGLDPASQFLHDAFDGVAPGVAPLVPRSVRPPSSDAMFAALESLHGCACKEGVKKGDACGQGGTVATDTDWAYIDGACHLAVPCENQACYNVAKAWTDDAVGDGENSACRRACEGKGSAGTITGFDCNLADGGCDCTATCACVDGGTGSTEVNGLSPGGSQYSDLTDWDGLCPPTSEWTMPGSDAGWGDAPGGGGTSPSPDPGELGWEPPGSSGAAEAGLAPGDGGANGLPCSVYVAATEVRRPSGPDGVLLGYHLLLVYVGQLGDVWYFAGQPDDNRDLECPLFGRIRVDAKGGIGIPTNAVLATAGPQVCSSFACLAAETARINAAQVCYNPTGPNSNSVAYTLLTSCGLPAVKPPVSTPGWGETV